LVNGKTHYPLTAPELAAWMKRFIVEDGVNLVGGCCGTTDAHIQAVDAMLRELDPGIWAAAAHCTPQCHWVPAVASLYGQVALRQENSIFSIGERCNANGSKAWRQAQEAQDWEACVGMAKRANAGRLQRFRYLHSLCGPR
jgi:5-methyltetrahydrofolate--homocysteine methyltransferase